MKNLLVILGFISFSSLTNEKIYAAPLRQGAILADCTDHTPASLVAGCFYTDSVPFARAVIYRPENQLTRSYHLSTNTNNNFSIKKKEAKTLEVFTNVLEVEVNASGHKTEQRAFALSPNKIHYFRVQDRNNYSGLRPFLEVIEVTEETYRKDMN